MEYYCSSGDASSILLLFRQMRNASGVYFDSAAYALILVALTRCGVFRRDAEPRDGVVEAGFSVSHGPQLFDEFAAEMAEDIMEITEASAQVIAESFAAVFLDSTKNSKEVYVIPTLDEASAADSVLVGRVTVNDTTAICPASRSKLRLFELNESQRKHVHDTLLEMANIQHREFLQKSTNEKLKIETDPDYAFKELAHFSEWLE
jgi:hypothetical protein